MKQKVVFYFLCIIVFCAFLLQGKNKPPAISMKELTDHSSPSYVPYPYPKNNCEILEDLKYAIRYDAGLAPNSRKLEEAYISKEVEKKSKERERLVQGLIEEKPRLFIKDIVKVTDLKAKSSLHFYYLITLVNNEQKIQCVAQMCDNGLWGGFMFIDQDKEFQPYIDQEKATTLFLTKFSDHFVQKMECVYFDSNISNPFYPLWRIETDNGTFFIDYQGDLYKMKEESIPLGEGNIYDLSPEQKNEILLFDDMHDQVHFLKKIE